MKKLIGLRGVAALLSAVMFAASGFGSVRVMAAAPAPITVVADGVKINCSPAPRNENGHILVPMDALFEAIGYSSEWDDRFKLAKGRMTAEDGGKRNISVNTKALSLAVWEIRPNGDRVQFIVPLDPKDAPIKNVDGHLLLPIGVIAKVVGCDVKWDGTANKAVISTAGAKIVPPAGWVQAIEAHYAKYAPEQLAARQSWIDNEVENQRISGEASVKPAASKPAESKGVVYTVFSERYNRTFEYTFKKTAKPIVAPKVGSVPAKILLDESIPQAAYPDPKNPGQWIENLRDAYDWAGSAVVGGCEWYAGGRFKEVYGVPFNCFEEFFLPEEYLDIADQYDEFIAVRDKYDVRDNSIVVYGKGSYKSGHVAYVEYVERDANGKPVNVYFTEANANNPEGGYRHGIDGAVKVLSINDFLNRSKPTLGYVIPNPAYYGK